MPQGRKSSRDRKVDPKGEEEEEENGRRIRSGGSRGHVGTRENIYTRNGGARKTERGSMYGAFTGSGYGNRGEKREPK